MKNKLVAVANHAPTASDSIAEMNEATLKLIGLLVARGEQDLPSILTEALLRLAEDLLAAKHAALSGEGDAGEMIDALYFRLRGLAQLSRLDGSSFERGGK